ncbi:MAG TPA: DinB family protein [Verrucomicrobiae bacterium]|nr:DinB family protein [Verrucomicrobiae bacterium]
MSDRGDRCAQAILTRIAALGQTLAPLEVEQWRRPCEGEGWPLGLVASHIGLGLDRQAGWIEEHGRSGQPHAFNWDETNELNAENARRRGLLSKMSALRFLRDRADHIAAIARSLTDEQLDAVVFSYEEKGRTAEWVISVLACRHIDEHHRSIKAALGAP